LVFAAIGDRFLEDGDGFAAREENCRPGEFRPPELLESVVRGTWLAIADADTGLLSADGHHDHNPTTAMKPAARTNNASPRFRPRAGGANDGLANDEEADAPGAGKLGSEPSG
jgi:hypothetical protein